MLRWIWNRLFGITDKPSSCAENYAGEDPALSGFSRVCWADMTRPANPNDFKTGGVVKAVAGEKIDIGDPVCWRVLPEGWNVTQQKTWNRVHYPIKEGDFLPPERQVVLCWLLGQCLPYCGYIRYAAGDRNCPYFVVYHGNTDRGSDVVAWFDCLPLKGPEGLNVYLYENHQPNGGGRAGGVWMRTEEENGQ